MEKLNSSMEALILLDQEKSETKHHQILPWLVVAKGTSLQKLDLAS